MLKQTVVVSLLVASSLALTACDAMYTRDKSGRRHLSNTAAGAGIGAVGGGVLGAAVGGHEGAIIGAGAGAVAGGVVGNQMDK